MGLSREWLGLGLGFDPIGHSRRDSASLNLASAFGQGWNRGSSLFLAPFRLSYPPSHQQGLLGTPGSAEAPHVELRVPSCYQFSSPRVGQSHPVCTHFS